MITSRIIFLIVAVLIIASAITYIQMGKITPEKTKVSANPDIGVSTTAPKKVSPDYPRAKEIVDPTGFINTPNGLPITISQYMTKKVILIDFWTYSCINCQRTIPYLNDWYSKYADKGFIIIGIHTPEFDFEKDINNVRAATTKFGIKYPVVLDSNYGTWNTYGNRYWPREYLIDLDGFIREDHIGEGGYAETEAKIQELLKVSANTVSNPKSQMENISGETYFGTARGMNVDSDLVGNWKRQVEYAETTGEATLVFPYTAKDVYVVAESDTPENVEIFIDGKSKDSLSISKAELYTLISHSSVESHTLTVKTKNAGVKFFTLTFGS